jgi:hypothetical protein
MSPFFYIFTKQRIHNSKTGTMRKVITCMIILAMSLTASAQFMIDGQLRQRAEFRDGYRQLPSENSNPAALIAQRTRLNLSYAHDERLRTRISFQDLRVWGAEEQMVMKPSFGLYEAWLALDFTESFSLQAGRQELRYDKSQRLMSFNDWAPRGRTHDAIVFKYENANSKLHIGGAFNQSQDKTFETHYPLDNYKTLNYLWYNTNLTPSLNTSFHFIADGFEHPDDPEEFNVRLTWAGFLTYNPGSFELRFQPAFQHGKTESGQDISAFYTLLEAHTNWSDNVNTTAGFELFSGNDAEDPGDKFNAFSDLYGVGHARNGFMDYFISFPNHTKNAGLINPYIRNNFKVSDNTTLSADLHLFFIQNNFVYESETIDKYLGTEVDLTVNYRFNDITRIFAGYSVLFASESMEAIKGGSKDEFAHWAFVMIRITPRFL